MNVYGYERRSCLGESRMDNFFLCSRKFYKLQNDRY